MEAKRSNLQTIAQYNSAGHRINPGLSKIQVAKNPSGVSLTPSQAAEQAKLNALKHPLDALSKLPTRQQTIERRSGLQDVDEEYLKQNIFRKSLYPRTAGRNEANAAQNQILNPPAAGQPSIPPSQVMQQNPPNPNQTANQSYVQAQQQNPHYVQAPQQNQPHVQTQQQNPHYVQAPQQNQSHAQAQQQNQFHQSSANLNPTQMQMQMQPPGQVPAGAGNVQGQQQNMGQAKNQMNHPPVAAQQDFQKQINPEHTMNMNGHRAQQSGQPPTMNPNHNAAASPPPPEPDMCTTCPNCQTTIYLVRGGGDMNNEMHQQVSNNLGQQMMSENVNVGAV